MVKRKGVVLTVIDSDAQFARLAQLVLDWSLWVEKGMWSKMELGIVFLTDRDDCLILIMNAGAMLGMNDNQTSIPYILIYRNTLIPHPFPTSES